jgi:predicted Fe-S protein YdhL (DUF1289 family)
LSKAADRRTQPESEDGVTRHSPCVGVCKLEDTSGYCLGCGRNRNEISDWVAMGESQRDEVWLKLPERLAALSVRVRLLPWTPDELGVWVTETVASRCGSWVVGAPGGAAVFACTSGREIDIERTGDTIVARAPDARLRFRINDKLRAFAFSEGGIVLGLPKGRAAVPSYTAVTALGVDVDAIEVADQKDQWFDLGTGQKSSRLCVRTADESLATQLSEYAGRHWSEVVSEMQIASANPTRVIESAVARIELWTRMLLPGEQSVGRADTHLQSALFKLANEAPMSSALPEYALPVASFYPTRGLA